MPGRRRLPPFISPPHCSPSQFTYCGPDPVHKYLTLVVDDGIQPPVELSCKDRNIMAATFIRFLHKNIGSSTFQCASTNPSLVSA